MDLLKKHYEKVVLGIVLVGLAVSAGFLPLMISGERKSLDEMSQKITKPAKPLPALELAKEDALLRRTQTAFTLDFKETNKLFNSVPWQRTPPPESRLIKVQKGNVGVEAVVVTKTSPLYLIITLDGVSTNATGGVRYAIGVEREAATKPEQRKKKTHYASLNNKAELFFIRDVRGPVDNPTELVLELNDTPEQVVVKKGIPFKQVEGYTADLKYDPERKTWSAVR